jgi:hypothetical protein
VDDRKRIIVTFEEPDAPAVLLDVVAKVREDFRFSQKSIRFRRSEYSPKTAGNDGNQLMEVEICQYYGDVATDLSARTSAEWISCQLVPVAPPDQGFDDSVVSKWILKVDVTPHGMTPGNHRGTVDIVQLKSGVRLGPIIVDLEIRPPVVCVPSQVFFGECMPAKCSTRELQLQFANVDSGSAISADDIDVTHTFSDRLTVAISENRNGRMTLRAELTPDSRASTIDGEIRLHFHSGFPDVVIPVLGFVKNAEQSSRTK